MKHALILGVVLAAAQCVSALEVSRQEFGKSQDGQQVYLFTLKNDKGLSARVMTYGAIIYSLDVPDKRGVSTNVTANRETLADYEAKSPNFGSVVARYANRISNARFTIDAKTSQLTKNHGEHHIHGGPKHFGKVVWRGKALREKDAVGVQLDYVSKDGDEGFPGEVKCTITYRLNNNNEWVMDYVARTDKPTHFNISNHAYWNLAGAYAGDVLQQTLMVNADHYCLVDANLIPTGEIVSVAGKPVDFRQPHRIGERMANIPEPHFRGGYDHCLVLNKKHPGELSLCARVKDEQSGRVMEVYTTEPGVQVFSANFAEGSYTGPNGYVYPKHLGICLETQHFPDSPNKAHFPSTLLRPEEAFRSTTIHRFLAE